MGAHPTSRAWAAGGVERVGAHGAARSPVCKVKGCERPHFVGGLCGFHALRGYYRAARRAPGPAQPPARLRLLRSRSPRPVAT
jgi:hypothetical protein